MKNYFVIHGSFGSPFGNWFPWLYSEIEKTKPADMEESICYCPQFPTGGENQNFENWERVLLAYVECGLINERTTIFAHSIAPIFVCQFLTKHKIKVGKLVFVCGFNNVTGISAEYDKVNSSMFMKNPSEIKKFCTDIVCLYSDNDPYVKFSAEKAFADEVATEQIIVEKGGHLNASFGYTSFPKLLNFI